jgi:PAS domain S-box-containing protein
MSRKSQRYIAAGIGILAVTGFLEDIKTRQGMDDWVWYLFALLLTIFLRRRTLPLWLAGGFSILTLAGFQLSPPGLDRSSALVNCWMGIGVLWITAALITVNTQKQGALRQTHEQMRLFVEHSPAAVAMLDRQMRYLVVSRRWLADYHLKRESILGASHYEIFPEVPDRWKEIHKRCLAGAVERSEADSFERPDGTTDWLRWEVRPWFESEGGIGGIIIFSELITERKKAENALRLSEEKFRQLAENISDVFWIASADMKTMEYVSPAFERVWGLSADSLYLEPRLWVEAILPEEREGVVKAFSALENEKECIDLEYRIRRPDGTVRWVHDRGFQVRDANGRVVRRAGVASDITERKCAGEALKASENLLHTVINLVPHSIFAKDRQSRHLFVNEACAALNGLKPKEMIGKRDPDFVQDPEQAEAFMRDDRQVIDGGRRKLAAEEVFTTPEGQLRILQTTKIPFESPGAGPAVLGVSVDITGIKRVEEALRERENQMALFVKHSPAATAMLDFQDRYLVVSERWLKDFHLGDESVIGQKHQDALPEFPARWAEVRERCFKREIAKGPGELFTRADGTSDWFEWEAHPWLRNDGGVGGIIIFSQVITDRKSHEQQVERFNRLYATLSEVNQAIVRCQTRKELFDEICRVMVEHGHCHSAWIAGVDRQGVLQTEAQRFEKGSGPAFPGWNGSCGVGAEIFRSNRTVICRNAQSDPLAACCRQTLIEANVKSCGGVPLRAGGRIRGVLTLCSRDSDFFGAEELQLLEEVASDVSYALERLDGQERRARAEEALRLSEAKFATAFANNPAAIAVTRMEDGVVLEVNDTWVAMTGYSRREITGRSVRMVWPTVEEAEQFVSKLKETGLVNAQSQGFRRKSGEMFLTQLTAQRMELNGEAIILSTFIDITPLRRTELALRETERRYQDLFEKSHDALIICDPETTMVISGNPAAVKIFGVGTMDELLKRGPSDLSPEFQPDGRDSKRAAGEYIAAAIKEGSAAFEWVHRRPSGQEFFASIRLTRIEAGEKPFCLATVRDISERKRAETALRASLEEKTALLKEVHHRVKNNLQVVASLVNLQAGEIENPEVLSALRDTQGRIRSMALLHETLYNEGNVARVNAAAYLGHLCTYLGQTHRLEIGPIAFHQRIAPVELELDDAIPCGLIVNELVSNAFKHAFPGGRHGQVVVELRVRAENRVILTVGDNGVGMAATQPRPGSLGMKLVRGLANQINASMNTEGPPGTRIEIAFQLKNQRTEAEKWKKNA